MTPAAEPKPRELRVHHGATYRWVPHWDLTVGTPVLVDPDHGPDTSPVTALTRKRPDRARTRTVHAVEIDGRTYRADELPGAWTPHPMHVPMLAGSACHPSNPAPFTLTAVGLDGLHLRFRDGSATANVYRCGLGAPAAWGGVAYISIRPGVWRYADDPDAAGMLALDSVLRARAASR